MSRDKFFDICRNLHFNNYDDPRALTDRSWKSKEVVEVLQRTFREGYVPPTELSFDEAMLPSRSSFNKMRIYMKSKPHKVFLLCIIHVTDQTFVELNMHYADSKCTVARRDVQMTTQNKTRKKALLQWYEIYELHSICCKTTYHSRPLLYVCGARHSAAADGVLQRRYHIMTNRVGYCKENVRKKKSRPKNVDRGACKIVESTKVNGLQAMFWMDSKPVHFLA
ncbi:hypothetical protein PHMEG_00026260 [Phytophthora megakarya]|uniref:PiggyBac transposable element-derived protein domain-containing protein n=1 Tax=Phytophthora megakarya TaxID=4795 RepID=A0A225VBE6_9STRA|nr:hypothetical protein PHMEG_00026260 [Phytophthora megakarya]